MLLAIDAGNTNCVFAVHDGSDFIQSWRCKTDAVKTGDEYASWLHQLFQMHELKFTDITDVIISSVIPSADFNLRELCEKHFDVNPLFVTAAQLSNMIEIAVDRPSDVGADRLVNSIAAMEAHDTPLVIIDFGTATTFDVISKDRRYMGGAIAPGVNLSMKALYDAAAKLPKIDIQMPDKVIGDTTVGAMQAGVYGGYVSMIEGLLKRTSDEMKESPTVLATGGLAKLFAQSIPAIKAVDNMLTLKGLYAVHKNLSKQKMKKVG